MAYSAAAIANEFLNRADRDDKPLTQMQIQKLVYFAHGWNLAFSGDPLIDERVRAWEYGPVVKSLYTAFREFGSAPITTLAQQPDWSGLRPKWITPRIEDGKDEQENIFTKALIKKVWAEYGAFNAFQLSEMTHVSGSPWYKARERKQEFISDEEIENYFDELRERSGNRVRAREPIAVS